MSDERNNYDQEAFDRGEWQVMAEKNSLGLNAHGIAMVHKNNPKSTRINKYGSLCLSDDHFNILLLGIGHFAPKKSTKKPVDEDYS